jgi:DNA-binding transcriptional MerR regulator|tara:strand:+ start:57 stop:455 length:399 start_codon:yes stop_codon:yes gene_type:complete
MNEVYTITELAREFEVTSRTIRFYEDKGLIAPERRGTTRLFSPRDRTRLRLILRGKRLGLTLAEIAEIVDMYDAEPGEKGQLELLIARIGERRAQLEQQTRDIDAILADLDGVEARCVERLEALAGAKRRRA